MVDGVETVLTVLLPSCPDEPDEPAVPDVPDVPDEPLPMVIAAYPAIAKGNVTSTVLLLINFISFV